jgi:hypothetical protein
MMPLAKGAILCLVVLFELSLLILLALLSDRKEEMIENSIVS